MKTNKYKRIMAIVLSMALCMQLGLGVDASQVTAAKKATLSTKKITATVGQKKTIKLKNKKKAAKYTFKSSKTKIATVSKSGKVTAKKKGSATITVKEKYKKKTRTVGKVKVTVKAKKVVQPSVTPVPVAPTITEAPVVTPTPRPDVSTFYPEMVNESLISTGNTYRMQKAVKKAQAGEPVRIACLGGSITEGAGASDVNKTCYAYKFYEMFKAKYGKDDGSNIQYCNAGMSGTPSSIGWVRYQRDVITELDGEEPDILIVEFAVNDADDKTYGKAYESIVRHALSQDNEPAVMLLFSVFQSGIWNLQERFIPIGNDYQLPMVSMKNAIKSKIEKRLLTTRTYWSQDGWHPVDFGHKLMADCLMNCVDQAVNAAQAEAVAIPEEATIGKEYDTLEPIFKGSMPADVVVNAGGFSENDTTAGTFNYTKKNKFPSNWKHSATSGATEFSMDVTCKNMLMIFKYSSDKTLAGKADVYVDGVKKATCDSYNSGAWNNPWCIEVFNETTAKKHKITVKMAAGSEAKEFTIFGFGASK